MPKPGYEIRKNEILPYLGTNAAEVTRVKYF